MEFKFEYTRKKESVTNFNQVTSVKVKKILTKSQAQFWEKLTNLRFRENEDLKKNGHTVEKNGVLYIPLRMQC